MMETHCVYRGLRIFLVKADVPRRCRFVWDCLRGVTMQPSHVRTVGTWRYIDLQNVTGHSSSDVKMRELARLNPGLFVVRKVQSETSAARYVTYAISKKAMRLTSNAAGGR